MKKSTIWFLGKMTLTSVALAAGSGVGCGGGEGGGQPPVLASSPGSCPESGMPKLPAICCESGERIRFDGVCAGPELAPIPPQAGALSGGSTAAAIAQSSNQAAAALVCPAGTVVTSENKQVCAIATTSGTNDAATAGEIAMAPPPTDPKKELETGSGIAGSKNGSGGDSGGGGGSMSGGGMGSLFAGKTAPSAPETQPNLVMNSGNAMAPTVGDGAKMPGSRSGSGLSWSSLGQSARAPGGGVGSTTAFGSGSANGVNPIGSADPEDYFTKLGLGDSIFKVVERRYRTKSMDWISSDLSGGKSHLK